MSKDVVTVYPDDSLHDALQLMVENRVSALPVVDRSGHCVGILSASDLIGLTQELDNDLADLGRQGVFTRDWLIQKLTDAVGRQTVAEQMTGAVASIRPNATLLGAAREMLKERVHRLPVVDGHRRLVGIISTTDILRAFSESET